MKNLRIIIAILIIGLYTLGIQCVAANAYVFNGYKMSNPQNVKMYTSPSVSAYTQLVQNYAKRWNDCSEISLNTAGNTGDYNIKFCGEYNIDNQTYGVTAHKSNNSHIITFYNSFAQAEVTIKRETVVHEVGHALGLAHCQEEKNGVSVMRRLGFNGKAKPLSDDIAGIRELY